jgi:DNA-binding CsgD family transcriptional regulator
LPSKLRKLKPESKYPVTSVEHAIENFRDAALLPERWEQALDQLGQVFQSDGATLVFKATTMSSVAVSSSIRPFLPLYMNGPYRDPRENRCKPGPREGFMPDHAYFSAKEIAQDPYYQEFMRPNGFGWNAVASLQGDLMVSFKRAFKRGPYDGEELNQLNAVLPWLRSVSRTACMTWHSNFVGQISAFERLGRGAILIDAKARVLQVNAHVCFGDGLDVVGGVLQASRLADRDAWRKFLAALLASSALPSSTAPLSLTLPRPSGARPRLLDGIICTNAIRSLHSNAAALVLITDLEHARSPRDGALSQLFGLTPTECALARRLTTGESLQDAAYALAISLGHARQRLKSIFNKTGTCRQGELIALMSKLS